MKLKKNKKATKQDKFSSFLIYFNGLIIDYNSRLYSFTANFMRTVHEVE